MTWTVLMKSYWHIYIACIGNLLTVANITNNFDGVAHSGENKNCTHDRIEDDMLIVGVINSVSVCCGSYLTWGLFTQSESLQPLWSSGTEAMPALCPAWMLCPGASTDGMKETLNCGEKPKASTWGLTRGDIMVEQTHCSHHQAPVLPQLGAVWVFKL